MIGEEIENELKHLGLPDRAAVTLTNACFGHKVRNEVYRRDSDVSLAVASRDLRALVEAELLIPHGEARGRHYEAGQWLVDLRRKFRDSSPIPSPFEVVHGRAKSRQPSLIA